MTDGRPLINIKRSKGPSMLPCGTPEMTGRVLLSLVIHYVAHCQILSGSQCKLHQSLYLM